MKGEVRKGEVSKKRLKELSVCYIYGHVKQIFDDDRDFCHDDDRASLNDDDRAFFLLAPFESLPFDVHVRRGSSDAVLPFQ